VCQATTNRALRTGQQDTFDVQDIRRTREPTVADKSSQPTRSQSQIEADMDATRQRLTSSVESLIDQVHPNRIKQRAIDRVRLLVSEYTEKAKSLVFNARGDLRTNRVAAVGGGVAGFVALVTVLRRVRSGK
jgi:hypothetical protein